MKEYFKKHSAICTAVILFVAVLIVERVVTNESLIQRIATQDYTWLRNSLIGSVIGILVSKFVGIESKKKTEEQELNTSRIFVKVDLVVHAAVDLHNFCPGQPKRKYESEADEQRDGSADAVYIKVVNPSDITLRNVKVKIHTKHNYEDAKRTIELAISEIVKDEWCMILLPRSFSSYPANAFMAGLVDRRQVTVTESVQFVEVEYDSIKNERLMVEANFNGRIRHYIDGKVVCSFENTSSYSYGA